MYHLGGVLFVVCCSSPFLFVYVLDKLAGNSLGKPSIIEDINEVEAYIKKESNDKLRDINIKLLEDFAKTKKEITLIVDREKKIAFIDVITNDKKCAEIVANHFWTKEKLKMDGKEIPIIDNKPAAELYCELPEIKKEKHHFSAFYRLSDDATYNAPFRKEYPNENITQIEEKKSQSSYGASYSASSSYSSRSKNK